MAFAIRAATPEDAARLHQLHMDHALAVARHGHDGPIRIESTLNAARFYERFGFREVGRSSVRRSHVDSPVVLMERP
jgi:predicted GNAT family N-acyltransferase